MEQATPGPSEAGVLADVRVVEFSQNAAVPQCARLFAGMGADVIKVEPPKGDAMRHLATIVPNESRAFSTINPGKRTISIDLGSKGAQPVVDRLLKWADIALIGMKAQDVARYGLDWEHAKSVNRRLVALMFTAYGPEGPDADAGGYDMLIQAVSGVGFSMNRSSNGVPEPTRPAFIDFASGATAAAGVLAALRHRDRTGLGQRVDASLLGTALTLGTPMMSSFEVDEERMSEVRHDVDLMRQSGASFDEWRDQYESQVVAGAGVFRLYVRPYQTADGLISIAGFSPGLMTKLHDLLGLARPPAGSTPNDVEFQDVVSGAEALFASKSTDEWLEALQSVGYPSARYSYPQEAIENPQVVANDYVVDLVHDAFGRYRTVGMPFRFSDTPVAVSRPSPLLGEHTEAVLGELGLTGPEIEQLFVDGVVSGPPEVTAEAQ